MRNNITLIGMAGAGKSAVGKALAEKLDYKFIDVDGIIEKNHNLRLQEILEKFGEKKFIEIEEKEILALDNLENCVISPGGSVVYSEKAMEFLKKNSKIIFLDAPLEMIESRIKNYETRGIIGLKSKSVKEIFLERHPLYEKWADIKIENNTNVGHIAKIIISKFLSLDSRRRGNES